MIPQNLLNILNPEAIKTALAEKSLYHFVQFAWHIVEPATPFVDGKHIKLICDELQNLDPFSSGGTKSLLINIPPRHAKSLIVSVFWPVWLWITKPSVRFLASSYSLTLATRDNLRRRRLIESAWFQERFSDRFKLTGDQNAKTRFENDKGGQCLITSPDSAATGEGGEVILCDDPHNVKESTSEADRERTITWWRETMSTRLNNASTGIKVVIGQRICQDDLSGYLIERGGYRHLCLPARYEPSHPYPCELDWRSEEGELLWPQMVTQEVLDSLKVDLGARVYAGQYQQRPSPAEGTIIKVEWLRYYTEKPERFDLILQSWDCTFKDTKSSDFVVGQIWGKSKGLFYLIDMVRGRWDFPTTIAQIKALTARYPQASLKLIEDKANGSAVISTLKGSIPGLVPVNPKDSKVSRLNAVSPVFESGNVLFPQNAPWLNEFTTELTSFPSSPHDDMVDSCSQALNRLTSSTGVRTSNPF